MNFGQLKKLFCTAMISSSGEILSIFPFTRALCRVSSTTAVMPMHLPTSRVAGSEQHNSQDNVRECSIVAHVYKYLEKEHSLQIARSK